MLITWESMSLLTHYRVRSVVIMVTDTRTPPSPNKLKGPPNLRVDAPPFHSFA